MGGRRGRDLGVGLHRWSEPESDWIQSAIFRNGMLKQKNLNQKMLLGEGIIKIRIKFEKKN